MSDRTSSGGFAPLRGALATLVVLLVAGLALVAGGWRVRAFVAGTTDLGSYFVPKYQYAADRIADGELPQWNPYEFGGIPFLATIQPGVFYPPLRAAYALLSGEDAYRVLFVAHLVVAALGAMLLARDLGLRLWPAVLAAAWVTQPTWLVRLYDHPIYLTGATWIPYLLLVSRRLVQEPTARRAALLGLLAALLAVSGYPPLVLATGYLLLLGLPFWLLEERATQRRVHVGAVLGALAAAALLAALLAAVQLLPLLELSRLTNRALESESARARLADLAKFPPSMLFAIGVPQMTFAETLRVLWRVFGALLPLCALGVVLRPTRPTTWFLVAAVVLCAALPFGGYAALPLYSFVRFAAEWSYIAPLAVYLCAAWGLDALLDRLPRLARADGAAAALAVLALATGFNWRQVDARWLTIDIGTPPPIPEAPELCDVRDPRFRAFWPLGLMRGSLMNERVRSPSGYEQSLLPDRSARLTALLGIGNGAFQPTWAKNVAEQQRAASRLALRCVLTPWAPVLETARFIERSDGAPATRVYENPDARPRARLERTVHRAASPDDALALLASAPVDGVILEEPASPDDPPPSCADAEQDRATIVQDDPEHVRVVTTSACPAFLVLADTHLDGWTATLDGAPTPILHADFAFRAVRVPAGEHEVAFRYVAPGLRAGIALSLAGLVATTLLLCRRPRRGSRHDRSGGFTKR